MKACNADFFGDMIYYWPCKLKSTVNVMGSLSAAHRGYLVQDVLSAYVLAESLVNGYETVTIDRKKVASDIMDDLEIKKTGTTSRRQLKTSADLTRPLEEDDFNKEDSRLRIDLLVKAYVRGGDEAATEYLLCTTWQAPSASSSLFPFVQPIVHPETVAGSRTSLLRLRHEEVWPIGSSPRWKWLEDPEITHASFVSFCDRFFIELELPSVAGDLLNPGPLDKALLQILKDRVGIGQYPNRDRNVEDVASRLCDLAHRARVSGLTLTPADVEQQLNIQTDYGFVAQSFPIDESHFLDRQEFRPELKKSALNGLHQLVTGPPGCGKSWELTKLAEEIRDTDVLVAKHYCYLAPGDQDVERRVLSDTLFGNLVHELISQRPELKDVPRRRYAAGPIELQELLDSAVQYGHKVVLIVDGLDHISRVASASTSLSVAETDIVAQLAALRLPAGVSLIIGSQPGSHLDQFTQGHLDFIELVVEPWSRNEILQLLKQLGLIEAIADSGLAGTDSLLDELILRTEGSPLYATYLAKEALEHIRQGSAVDFEHWVESTVVLNGDIAAYYNHLYQGGNELAQYVANVLGAIDFSISERDLSEIVGPALNAGVTTALKRLSPILHNVSSQGGIRIFHESFRRFITERHTSAEALSRICDWLSEKGFYEDARAYRFLLPALRRASRSTEILELVDAHFASASIANGHAPKSIERNLAITLQVAADQQAWTSIVKCAELGNAVYTCFNEALNGREVIYWKTFGSVFGAPRLSECLLFDGIPTQPSGLGLFLCSHVADGGGNPPWQIYLDEHSKVASTTDDDEVSQQALSLARLHGRIQLQGIEPEIDRLINYFDQQRSKVEIHYVRAIAKRLVECGHAEAIDHILARVHVTEEDDVWEALALERAISWLVVGEPVKGTELATRVITTAANPALIADALNCGGDCTALPQVPELLTSSTGLDEDYVNEESVSVWVATVRILAYSTPERLTSELPKLSGNGWYRCWLRFQVLLALADASRKKGSTYGAILEAYQELAKDVSAVEGRPRASDLYRITHLILESLTRSFEHLVCDEQWKECLVPLKKVVDGTSVSFRRDSIGPIAPSRLLDILLPYAKHGSVSAFAKDLIRGNESDGTYFSEHAQQGMRLAQILVAGGFLDEAKKEWSRSAVLLTGYGWHKDETLGELVGSLHSFSGSPTQLSLKAAMVSQPLCEAMRLHTDGKGTMHFRGEWFKALTGLAPIHALEVLGRSQAVRDGPTSGIMNDATLDAINSVRDAATPQLAYALECTVPYAATYAEEATKRTTDRLRTIERLLASDKQIAGEALRTLVAQIEGESPTYAPSGLFPVREFAERHSLEMPPTRFEPSAGEPPKQYDRGVGLAHKQLVSPCFFAEMVPGLVARTELVLGVQRMADAHGAFLGAERHRSIAALGYRIIDLVQTGNEEFAGQLLRLLGRSLHWYHRETHPLVDIAEGLVRASLPHLATLAYTLAYFYTQGGNSWLAMGDSSHDWILKEALKTDKLLCQSILARQIAYSLRTLGTPRGITRHIIERIASWGDRELAAQCWWSAFNVIERRIPTKTGDLHWTFEPLDPSLDISWTVDESLVYVLLCRLSSPEQECKAIALVGFSRAVKSFPQVVPNPLRRFLTLDTPTSSLLALLQVLLSAEEEPYPVTQAVVDLLHDYTLSESYGARELSVMLLSRIRQRPRNAQIQFTPPQASVIVTVRPLVEAHMEKILSELEALSPGIAKRVRDRQVELMNTSLIHKRRRESRLKWMWGELGDQMPPDPVLLWDTELLLTALHEALQGLNQDLWRQGRWDPTVHSYVLHRVLPFTALHLAIACSRHPRPLYTLPENIVAGRSEPYIIMDPPFKNWIRCGYIERQWVRSNSSLLEPPEFSVLVLSGLILEAKTRIPHRHDYPFADGLIEGWWNIPQLPIFPNPSPFRPVLGATRITDWLGDRTILSPPLLLGPLMDIEPPEFGNPLRWVDSNGEPMVVLRAWRCGTMSELYFGPLEFEGCDVIVHPEAYSKLIGLTTSELSELTVIIREDLSAYAKRGRTRKRNT